MESLKWAPESSDIPDCPVFTVRFSRQTPKRFGSGRPPSCWPPGAFTLRGSIASGSPDFLASSLSRAQGRVPGTGTGRDPGSGSIEPDQEARFSGWLWSMERPIVPPGKITLSVAESDVAHVGMPLILPRGEKRERALRSSPSRWFLPRLICLKAARQGDRCRVVGGLRVARSGYRDTRRFIVRIKARMAGAFHERPWRLAGALSCRSRTDRVDPVLRSAWLLFEFTGGP